MSIFTRRSRLYTTTVSLFWGIVFMLSSSVFALQTDRLAQFQNDSLTAPIKVGLVLSGGGAKGLAHIGALKVIEAAGVQIDYIAGTSMGAVVGALYASGYSSQQLDSIFRQLHFDQLIADDFSRTNKTFYDKEDADRYALSLPFDGYKISFPQALSGGQKVYNELVELLFPVKDIRDFNKLPIPFFCMATDIENGTSILLDTGYLPEAVMASATFPSLFEPMELDGHLLLDGGVLNNYPIDEIRTLGANFVIGVDVQHELSERASLGSATDILIQINNFRTAAAMEEKSAQTDIYIRPDIDRFSVVDFGKAIEIEEEGQKAAMEQMSALEILGSKQKNKQRIPSSVGAISKNPLDFKISYIEVNGVQNYSNDYVKGKLLFREGDQINFETLKRGINNLAATDNFKTIRYKMVEKTTGLGLVLNLVENTNKTNIRFAAHYDKLYKSAALLNITRKNVLRKDDVASLDFIFGDYLRYQFDYYVDKGFNWSFGLSSKLDDFDFDIPYQVLSNSFRVVEDSNLNAISIDFTDITNQIYIKTVYQNAFSVLIGAEHKWLSYSSKTLFNDLNEGDNNRKFVLENSHFGSLYANLKFDTLDHSIFSSSGLFLEADFHSYFLSSDYNGNFNQFSIFKAKAMVAFKLHDNLSMILSPEVGIKSGSSGTRSLDFALGGFGAPQINNFIPFLGYDFISIPGDSFLKGYTKLDFEISPKNHLFVAANIAKVTDDILRPGNFVRAPTYFGYGVGYGLESIVGPVQMVYTKSPLNGSGNLLFSVGFPF